MIKIFLSWLEYARWYALPMSFFSWIVIFIYALKNNGNIFYGLLALIGICFAHLGTNLFDDFFDYFSLKKYRTANNEIVLPNTQRGKCKYIIDKSVRLKDVFITAALFCLIALIIGIFFIFNIGASVNIFIICGAFIVLTYSFLSKICLAELAVGIAFGPLLFCGVYFVMTKTISLEAFILSIPMMLFTINLLYTDMFLDKNIDKLERKKTFAGLFKNNFSIIKIQQLLLCAGYLSVIFIPIFDIADWQVFCAFFTIPLAIDLINSLKLYSEDNTNVPDKKWYHFPFEKWEEIKQNRSPVFMFRMYQARNLMIYTSVLLSLGLLFD